MSDVPVFRDVPRPVDDKDTSQSNVETSKQEKKRPMTEAKRTAWEKCLLAKAKKKEEKERFLKDQQNLLDQKTHEIRESLKKEILNSMHGSYDSPSVSATSTSRKGSKKRKSKTKKSSSRSTKSKKKRSRHESDDEEEAEEGDENEEESESSENEEDEETSENEEADLSEPPSSSSESEEEERASRKKKSKKSRKPARKKSRPSSSSSTSLLQPDRSYYVHPPRMATGARKPLFDFV
jgi:hypothetical protein